MPEINDNGIISLLDKYSARTLWSGYASIFITYFHKKMQIIKFYSSVSTYELISDKYNENDGV